MRRSFFLSGGVCGYCNKSYTVLKVLCTTRAVRNELQPSVTQWLQPCKQ